MYLLALVKTHQQKLVLLAGFFIVAATGFGLGRLTLPDVSAPEIIVEETFSAPTNYTPAVSGIQSSQCEGQIKGSASQIYHIPGGAFYDRTTNPTRCFNTEAEAQAAGFRKAARWSEYI